MTPQRISGRVILDRLETIDSLLREIRALPLQDRSLFFADRRNIWSAESCFRRSLEALFDIGRHILAKGYGLGVSEYKEIALKLKEQGILTEKEASLLQILAGIETGWCISTTRSRPKNHSECAHINWAIWNGSKMPTAVVGSGNIRRRSIPAFSGGLGLKDLGENAKIH
jgi:uncharacterized protein YutE (UPF0331/DUF86 family)